MMGNQGGQASRRAQKMAAFAAAGIVLIGGATVTSLAAWNDQEFVFGGAGAEDPGVTASVFEVEQDVNNDGVYENDDYTPVGQRGGQLLFGTAANDLTPGESVIAWVELRTTASSTVGGELQLLGDPGPSQSDLYDELLYSARIAPSVAECTPALFEADIEDTDELNNAVLVDLQPLGADADNAFRVEEDNGPAAGTDVVICFLLTLPEGASEDAMGDEATPEFEFFGTSDES